MPVPSTTCWLTPRPLPPLPSSSPAFPPPPPLLCPAVFSDKARPPPLEHRHVRAYLERVRAGGQAAQGLDACAPPSPPTGAPPPAGPHAAALSRTPGRGAGLGEEADAGAGTGAPLLSTTAAAATAAAAGMGGAEGAGGGGPLEGPDGWALLFGGQVRACVWCVRVCGRGAEGRRRGGREGGPCGWALLLGVRVCRQG